MIDFDSDRSRGLLLIGHGSRDQQGTDQFFQLADRLAKLAHPLVVEPALLEFQQPTIADAWQALVARGVQHIHVAPLLLFAAGHAKQDIPAAIELCQRSTPGVQWDQSLPLSRHPAIIALVVSQIEAVVAGQGLTGRIALVMVGRGNRDPCAQADMRLLSEIVDHRVESVSTYTSFYAMADPKLTDVLSSVASCGRHDAIVVHPHLLFAGKLHQAIVHQTEQAAAQAPSIRFAVAPYLGPTAQVARAIIDRVAVNANSLSGDIDD